VRVLLALYCLTFCICKGLTPSWWRIAAANIQSSASALACWSKERLTCSQKWGLASG
jgi:hypothetical protein